MTKYIVFEIQTNVDGSVGTLVYSFDARADAESKFHYVLGAAAVSQLPLHSCVLMTNEGFILESKAYKHEQPESEPEPEEDIPAEG